VILDELVLENIGSFGGKNRITLAPPSPSKPVVLVGGLNGTGKTTILESIHLALYGSLSRAPGRRSGSYENYLRGLIHQGVPASEGAAVELTFHIYQQGEQHSYRIRRWWRETGSSLREIVLVWIDGKYDEALTSAWNEHVETFLPRGIAGLFFFDGEQIEALADLDRSRQVLSSALAALLGLDLIDRLATDLAVLRRRHRGAEVPEELRLAVDERRKTATSARQAEEMATALVATARVDAERADKRLNEATERYRAAGGGLFEQREAAETRVALMREQLHDLDEELRREAAEVAPLLQVTGLLNGLTLQTTRERDAHRDAVVLDVVATRDRELLERLRSAKVRAATIASVEEFLASDVAARQASSAVPRISGLRDPGALERLQAMVLPSIRKRLSALVKRRRALSTDLEQAERTLVAIPDPEALAPLKEEMDEASRDALRCRASLTQAEDRLGALRQERARADAAYEAALDKSAEAGLAVDDDRRLVEHAERVRGTLETLKSKATERHLGRISRLVLDALGRLLRKENLVTDVRIDPVSHTVELAGPAGRALPVTELSAGERQLMAVALLWGLAQAAGQPLPMVIDTPLGRLDGFHRGHLVQRYFPHASHQVILLSTDTEIDKDAFDTLRSCIGRAYRLQFDSTTNATAVEAGYFWE
jgi:DNA sulfur modification protein DndD